MMLDSEMILDDETTRSLSIMDRAYRMYYAAKTDLDKRQFDRAAFAFFNAIETLAEGWEAEVCRRELVEQELAGIRSSDAR